MSETITDFIRRDLKDWIRTSRDLPESVTLAELSERYQVSLTPVRLAVRELVAEQFLLKQDNRRLRINPSKMRRSRTSTTPIESVAVRPSGREASSATLEKSLTPEIIRRSLRGDATFLREEATAEQLGVGRTVIRQLFSRLAGRGLLEHVPRCGWRVRRFDEADMQSYLEARVAFELKALDLARPRLQRSDLEAMLAANENRAGGRPRLNNDLHGYLIEKSQNAYILDFFARFGPYYSTLFDFAAPEARVVRTMARQHCQILRALIAADWPTARKALAHHIRAQRPILLKLLEGLQR